MNQGMNPRYHHCFTDEDSMRWVKTLARSANAAALEGSIMKMNLTRFASMKSKQRTLLAKQSARKRAARDDVHRRPKMSYCSSS